MAASDPVTDVPTPTGTLQGVAAFSWDGTNWQPAGRAGPSVATPTGVLRGVAAFNGGPSWQPAGLAQPAVATPTGALDGVAVYTWTGDSWAPPGGQPTPATPHGSLRGVAAFNFDGTAWQPASQAGPSVATPYGVLDGVAMFNWSGSAWAAAGASSLSLDFMSPGTLDPRITFTRASTATYFNSVGVMQTAAANAPRWDYNPSTRALSGLLIEAAATNLLLNSATLGTQGVAVTAQPYTLSFYGAGTITMSGAATGALVGTGAPQRVSQTFTPTAGTLTCTVTGSVLNAQLEAGGFATSYIPTTAAAVTRAADLASMPVGAWFNTTTGTYQIEFIPNGSPNTGPAFLSGNAGSPTIGTDGFNQLNSAIRLVVQVFQNVGPTFAYGSLNKAAFGYVSGASMAAVNGTAFGPNATTFGALAGTVVQLGSDGITPGNNSMDGWLRRVSYWPRVLTNAELQSVTT